MNNTLTSSGLPAAALRGLRAGTVVLLAGWLALPTEAAQSNPTGGRIQGRAPEATGTLSILMPDGTTPLVNNAKVSTKWKPSEFTLGPLTPALTYNDLDGDAPAGAGITLATPPGVTWIWKNGTRALTAAQLNQLFETSFPAGTKLTVTAQVPLKLTSLSGAPNTGVRTVDAPTYTVETKAPPNIKIRVNGADFNNDGIFPTTGFIGAKFQYLMNGTNTANNANYTYTSNQPWAVVDAAGGVTFTGEPPIGQPTARVTITDTAGVEVPVEHRVQLRHWFSVLGEKRTYLQARADCGSLQGGYAMPKVGPDSPVSGLAYRTLGPHPRVTKYLAGEWGDLMEYGGKWADPQLLDGNGQLKFHAANWQSGSERGHGMVYLSAGVSTGMNPERILGFWGDSGTSPIDRSAAFCVRGG